MTCKNGAMSCGWPACDCQWVDTLERLAERNAQLRQFALRLLDPEDLGYAVTPEVRDCAREALGRQRSEG